MTLKALELTEEERANLETLARGRRDWRTRDRSRTILMFSEGVPAKEIAKRQGLTLEAVYERRYRWLAKGVAGLSDAPRSGAPSKLSLEQLEQLKAWASEDALTATALLTRLEEKFGVRVHVNTLTGALKRAGLVWKRTRHSLKKRNEEQFRQAQVGIGELVQQAERGEIELAYIDEVGFAQAHPNRSAWTPVGERHMIEARRGKRLNVVGALLSSGGLFAVKLWETMTAMLFAGFLGMLVEHVGKPLTVILDNASVHTAKALQPYLKLLRNQGLTLYFLPPYSPELNRIEKLWHKMKYEWLAFKARDAQTLEADVDTILREFGSNYRFTFC
jgi:transposase